MPTLSTDRTVRVGDRPLARCEGGQAEQSPFGSAGTFADGFLSHSFLPLCEPSAELPEEQITTEGFFKSLGYLCCHYGLKPFDVSAMAYPANVLLATWQVRRQVKKQGRRRDLAIIEQEDGQVTLKVTETLNTGNTLFYIPVITLFHWHNQRKNRKTAELLLGICAYLFNEVGVPYFRDPDTYMQGNYEMIQQWVDDDCGDMDKDDLNKHQNDLNKVYHFGDLMEKRIKSKVNLEQLAVRTENFKVTSDFQRAVKDLAIRTLSIWDHYPKRNIYQQANYPEVGDEGYDEDYYNFLHIHEYVGFIGDTHSCLYDSMMDMINNDLNERAKVIEPQVTTLFDSPTLAYQDTLRYEHEVFELISDLCTLLNELP
jgi:hypothetical protein